MRSDRPGEWLAAVGTLCLSRQGSLCWPEYWAHAQLDIEDGVADRGAERAEQWLDSPLGKMDDVPEQEWADTPAAQVKARARSAVDYQEWMSAIDAYALNHDALWLHEVAERLAYWGPTSPREDLWWVVQPGEAGPGVLDRRYRRYQTPERDAHQLHRSRLRFGSGQATFGRAARKVAAAVLDDPSLITEALTWSTCVTPRALLRWTGHVGADWLALCGLEIVPRWWLSDVYCYPIWSEPLGIDHVRALCADAEAIEIDDDRPVWPPVIAARWTSVDLGMGYRSHPPNPRTTYWEWAGTMRMEAPRWDPPLGSVEVAELLNVEAATVAKWRLRKVFPGAECTVGGRPAWKRSTILEWAQETGRA